MKPTLRRTTIALLLLAATSTAVAADFDAGLEAYSRGDYATALREWRPLAEQGNPDAQTNLGFMYENGEGVPEDDRQAVTWYRKAAEQGHARAQNNLGVMYDNGEGVPEDDRQAVTWYRKAAEQGHAWAQNNLGVMYGKGEGVPEDDVLAYAWLNLAAAQGLELAKENRSVIRQDMTLDQITEGQRLSREFAEAIGTGVSEVSPAFAETARHSIPSEEMVLEAQKALAALGYDPGPLDGRAGQRTTAAVRQFQRDYGMTPNGRISDELLAELRTAAASRTRTPDIPGSSGSGFVVGDGGEIVTNHHVVDGCARITVSRAEALQDQGTEGRAEVRAVDPESDLALLVTSPATGRAATFSQSPRARLGEAVTAAGYPLHGLVSSALNVTSGNVSALAGIGDDAKRLQITAPVQPGNSGGPLFDSAGNVIGVVVSKLDAVQVANLTGDIPQNINFAVKGALVRGFLDIYGVKYRRRASEARLAPEQLADRARVSTVVVHCWK